MGCCSFYQAIAAESDLYRLIATDPEAAALLETIWGSRGQALLWLDDSEDKVNEIVAFHAEGNETALAEVGQTYDRLRAAARLTVARDDEVAGRWAIIEKGQGSVLEEIETACCQVGWPDGDQFAEQLVYGDSSLDSYGQTSLPLVRQAADLVCQLETLDPAGDEDDEDDDEDPTTELLALYLEAAAQGEVILIMHN